MSFEHERIAFLNELQHDELLKLLRSKASDLGNDDKLSHFFVLPNTNMSIAQSNNRAVLKLKNGQIGEHTGYEEYEVEIKHAQDVDQLIMMLSHLTKHKPQQSMQFRYNFRYRDVEIAVKYTQTWGFHAEFEVIYDVNTLDTYRKAERSISEAASDLNIKIASSSELKKFNAQWARTRKPRGIYTNKQYTRRYSSLYKQIATGIYPEQQVMDQPTLDWITDNLPANDGAPLEFSRWSKFIDNPPPTSWYVNPERSSSLHGETHAMRVGLFAAQLAKIHGHSARDQEVAFLSGMLHDIRRKNDRTDARHGHRSAEWVRSHQDQIRSHWGIPHTFDFHAIITSIRNHTSIHNRSKTWLAPILKTADALDRYRLPKLSWWPDYDLMPLPVPSELRAAAAALVIVTEQHFLDNRDISEAEK